MRRLLAAACLWLAAGAGAHDLITAESTRAWLDELDRWQAVPATAGAVERAQAAYRPGGLLDAIRRLLNQDLAAHGEVSGLATHALRAERQARGLAPRREPRGGFAVEPLRYRLALKLAPEAPFAADARYRVLDALYEQNLGRDPLGAAVDPEAETEMRTLAHTLLAREASHPRREDIAFMAALLFTRAGRDCRADAAAAGHARMARGIIRDFERGHPDSLRAAAMPILREALGHCPGGG